MIKLLSFLILCLSLMLSSGLSFASSCESDPRDCFDGVEDDGEVVPKDSDIKRTFSIPPVKAGFIIDFYHPDILPHIAMEVFEFSIPRVGDFAVDIGVSSGRVISVLTWEAIPVIKIGPTVWAGYNVRRESAAFGIGFSMLDF